MNGMQDDYVPLDKMAKAYVKIRDAIAELTKDYDNKVEALRQQQGMLKDALREELKKLGATSMKTREGTVIMSMKTRYFTNDWDEMKKFILDRQLLDLMEKRIAQKNMADYLREHPTDVPPGLNSESEYDISVRRA